MPAIWQGFIKKPAKVSKGIDFDRKLYIVRRVFEQASNGTYVPSLSSRTIVYKGMFLVHDSCGRSTPTCRTRIMSPPSAWCTAASPPTPTPAGMRAHPNRFILHNGEINTITRQHGRDAGPGGDHVPPPSCADDMNKVLPDHQHFRL